MDEVIERSNRYPMSGVKRLRVGAKKISIEDNAESVRFSFQRGVACDGGDDLSITVERKVENSVRKQCDLGHMHEVKEKALHQFAWLTLTWEEAEAVFSWFQSGTWREIREQKKREKDGQK